MRRVVTIRSMTRTSDGMGGYTETPTDVTGIPARIDPLEGTEQINAMQTGMQRPHRIVMRYQEGVTGAKTLVYGTRTFDIRSVVDPEERHRELHILADEVNAFTTTEVQIAAPPSGAVWRGHEPGGMTLIDQRPFDALDERDSTTPFWFRTNGLIATDATAPQSPPNMMRWLYPSGSSGGSAPGQTGLEAQGISYKTLYACWWARYSANWWGHLTAVNKQCFFAANGSAGQAFFEAHGAGSSVLKPNIVLQSGYATDATFSPNLVPSAEILRGLWFLVEVLLGGNTNGNADGTFDWYLNGVHVGSATGLIITTAAEGGATHWDRFNNNPTWGGQGDIVPADQTLDIDHIYLSGKN